MSDLHVMNDKTLTYIEDGGQFASLVKLHTATLNQHTRDIERFYDNLSAVKEMLDGKLKEIEDMFQSLRNEITILKAQLLAKQDKLDRDMTW